MLALYDGERVRLISRSGVDWTRAFSMIVAAVEALPVGNCLIDGEVITCDNNGVADFQLLRRRHYADRRFYAPLICSASMATICGASRSRSAKPNWRGS
jgi:ATP-dependent DNA ligase